MYTPTKFEIFGQTITIDYENSIANYGAQGMYIHDKKKIIVCTHNIDGTEHDEDFMSQILKHEQMHAILSFLGYSDLNSNEQFVDQVAQVLHQIEVTQR